MRYPETHPLIAWPELDATLAWRHGKTVSCRRFLADVMAVAASLPDRKYAINICTDRYSFLVGFAASLVRRQTSLLPPSRVTAVVVAIAAEYEDCYLLADTHVGDGALPIFCLALPENPPEFTSAVPQIELDHLAAIVFTSGSTGQAAPNNKPWRTLIGGARLNAAAELAGRDRSITLVATVPQQHMYGLETTIMLPLMGNCAIHCGKPFYPEDLRRALTEVPQPRILVTTPVHLRAFAASTSMPPVTEIWSATAPLSQQLAADCERLFHCELREIFGCTEAGSFATRLTARGETWRLYDAFRMTPHDHGAELYADHLPQPIQLQDSVEMIDQHHFRVQGRATDLVNIAGKRASLGDLNTRLLSIPGVRDGIIFMPDTADGGEAIRTAAMVVAPGMTRVQVLSALRELIDPAFLPRPLVLVDALPRNETSKLPRAALLRYFAETAGAPGND